MLHVDHLLADISSRLVVPKSNLWTLPRHRQQRHSRRHYSGRVLHVHCGSADLHVDVVVVGAGIIGLSTATKLLQQRGPALSVAVVDRAVPCAGATGAGQGYIWLAHRSIGDVAWQLAAHSKELWHEMLEAPLRGATYRQAIQWQPNGSMLLAEDGAGAAALETRAAALQAQGVAADVLSAEQIRNIEPAVALPAGGGSLTVPSDAQLDGRAAAAALQEACHAAGVRCSLLFNEGVEEILLEKPSAVEGRAIGVRTPSRRVFARRATVLCAGAWSGQLLDRMLGCSNYSRLITPLRGHLLQIPAAAAHGVPHLTHGLMETKYCAHYAAAEPQASPLDQAVHLEEYAPPLDITFTATMQSGGDLLLGSSRDAAGYDSAPSAAVVHAIVERSRQFLPGLDVEMAYTAALPRVGLRPHAVGGLPLVGPVPGVDGLFLNAGHSGSGLLLSPISAVLTTALLGVDSAADVVGNEKLRAAAALLAPPKPMSCF